MILITGSCGFIGGKLKKAIPNSIGIDFIEGKNILTCELPDADIVYHLAAQTSVEESWNDPMNDSDNLKITARIVKRYHNAKIIFAQSAASIGSISSPYGFSKWASGEYLKTFHSNYVSCVFPNVFGGGKGVVDIFKGSKNVTIYGDGLQTRDFVHVDDIVNGLLLAKDWLAREYQMGSNKATTILSLAEGKNITFEAPRKEARESILLNNTPNWSPKIDVFDYINS